MIVVSAESFLGAWNHMSRRNLQKMGLSRDLYSYSFNDSMDRQNLSS